MTTGKGVEKGVVVDERESAAHARKRWRFIAHRGTHPVPYKRR